MKGLFFDYIQLSFNSIVSW